MSAISQQDFNSMIRTLMTNYNSQTTAHAGYVVALAVGVAAILYQLKLTTFFNYRLRRRMFFFYIPLSILVGAIIFVILRIIFWGWMSSEVLKVPSTMVQNSTTPLWTIQQSLTGNYTKITGWSNICYALYGENYVYPIAICVILVLFYVLLFDFFYVYLYHKNKLDIWVLKRTLPKRTVRFKLKTIDMEKVKKLYIYLGYAATSILFILLLIAIIFPSWII